MIKRILFILFAFAILLGIFLVVFPTRSFFPSFFEGASCNVLIIYDEPSRSNLHRDQSDAIALRQLLGHFNVEVDLVTTGDYQDGAAHRYSRIFYLGLKEGQTLPGYLVNDLARTNGRVWWINANLWMLTDRHDPPDLGFHVADRTDRYPTNSVTYKDRVLWKRDPATYRVVIDDSQRVRVWAAARGAEGLTPWVLQSDRFWYLASNPFSFAVEGSCYLAFCDLLHEFIGQAYETRHRAMVRIEDVHVMRDPDRLRAVADYLHSEGIPFGFTLIPVYRTSADSPTVYMSDRPEFVEAVHYMVRKGGIPVLHGYTHQRVGETAVDYEFWTTATGGPRPDDSRALVTRKIRSALQECFMNQIFPLVWTTPHYSASQLDYSVFRDFFTTVWERRQTVDLHGSDQFFPYVIRRDMHSQIILPETLGHLTADGDPAMRTPEALIEDAANTLVVRDGYATFFYHSFLPLDRLQRTVAGIRDLGYEFVGLTDFNNLVSTGEQVILSGTVEVRLALEEAYLREFTIDENGNITNETYSFQPVTGDVHRYITLSPGRRKVLAGVRAAPPITMRNIGRFRPTLTGITHPLALFLLFIGLMILILFLVLWIYLLLQKILRTARNRKREQA